MRFEQKILSTKAFEKLNEKVNSLANNVKTGFFLAAISFIWQIIKPCIKKNDQEKEKKKESKGTNYEWIFYAIQIVSLICYFMAYSKISGISLNPDAYDWFSKTVIGPEIENVNYSRSNLCSCSLLLCVLWIFSNGCIQKDK